MPIYEYRCDSCGHKQEFLQKVSDVPLTVCPACGKATFAKMLTAAGFQLKGSGWYATDFRNKGAAPAAKSEAKSEGGDKASGEKAAESKSEGASSSGPSCGSGGCAACS